ncbi:MAG: AarF/ABC1/UbiB kinase family protein [bacterium]|nr:AarF/ABC1/UbiB kinase family protein [bacterium]
MTIPDAQPVAAPLPPVTRLESLGRTWTITRAIGGFTLREIWSHVRSRRGWLQDRSERDRRAAHRFRHMLVNLGPSFIKLGQMMSTRPDLVPRAYIEELAGLQDRVPAMSWDTVRSILESELGGPLASRFRSVERAPISAASIGQVHRAELHTGEQVAIKIQRPGLARLMARDVSVLDRIASWFEGRDFTRWGIPISPAMPYRAILRRFADSLRDQIDFELERHHMDRFRRNFEHFDGITAPRSFPEHSTTRVLTMEYIEGVKFDDDAGLAAHGVDFLEVANRGVRAFIKQVLEDGFFHGDTHPGNVLVRPDGEVVYLDFGMVDTMPPDTQEILVDAFVHLVHEDLGGFLEDMIRLGFLPPEVDRARLIPLVEEVYRSQLGLGQDPLSMQEIFQKLGDQLLDLPFCMPDRFTFLMRSVGCMEMVVRQRVPVYRFLEVGIPYAAKLMLAPERAAMREQLRTRLEVGSLDDVARWKTLLTQASLEPSFDPSELRAYLTSDEGIRWIVETLVSLPLEALSSEQLAEGQAWMARALPGEESWNLDWVIRILETLVAMHPTRVSALVAWGTRWLETPAIRERIDIWVTSPEATDPEFLARSWRVGKMILSDPRIDLEPFVRALVRALSSTELAIVRWLSRPGWPMALLSGPGKIGHPQIAEVARFLWSRDGRLARRRLTQAALGSWRHWLTAWP